MVTEKNKFLRSIHSPSSISIGSGLAGFVSGFGSISPGLSFRGSSVVSSSLSLCAALSLEKGPEKFVTLSHHTVLVLALTFFSFKNRTDRHSQNKVILLLLHLKEIVLKL